MWVPPSISHSWTTANSIVSSENPLSDSPESKSSELASLDWERPKYSGWSSPDGPSRSPTWPTVTGTASSRRAKYLLTRLSATRFSWTRVSTRISLLALRLIVFLAKLTYKTISSVWPIAPIIRDSYMKGAKIQSVGGERSKASSCV